jgi:hypothetical protein
MKNKNILKVALISIVCLLAILVLFLIFKNVRIVDKLNRTFFYEKWEDEKIEKAKFLFNYLSGHYDTSQLHKNTIKVRLEKLYGIKEVLAIYVTYKTDQNREKLTEKTTISLKSFEELYSKTFHPKKW